MTAVTASVAPTVPPAHRDEAIDVARAMAILGMFVIHAVLVLGAFYPRTGASAFVLWLCDGRAAATFVTLAGFGVARLAAKDTPDLAARTLRRRALALWVLGVLNLVIWPGDILRVYGVALLAAPFLLRWNVRARLLVSLASWCCSHWAWCCSTGRVIGTSPRLPTRVCGRPMASCAICCSTVFAPSCLGSRSF